MTPDKIRALRRQSGLTQSQFAELAHVTRDAVASWETGRSSIHPAVWDLLRAKVALRIGDEAGALAVLRREGLAKSAAE